MHNLDKILEHLGKCKPYAQQNTPAARRATFIGWVLFLISAAAILAVKLSVTTLPPSGSDRFIADSARIGVVFGALLLFIAFITQVVVDVRTTFRNRAESNQKAVTQRQLEVDENNVLFLLDQPDKSLAYAQCYLKQMNSRAGEWIAHLFGNAAPLLPLLVVLFAFSRDLGVVRWLERTLTQDHPSNPLVLRLIVFAIAVAILIFVFAYGLAAEQRRNSYRLGLLEMAITLKSMSDKPRRGRSRGGAR
ncbi:hypothetical protein WT26_08060 [Burkholderia cepacia]|uniref:Uncharacterized protein n=2 Tax=Burkholderia cepacia complex TaxID=87882 RepID=A0A1B4PPX6_BURCE|nr:MULTISPECIES: hypothetical protein [Burkholderia cepacia complex]AOK15977.1 hypothetical protein WT26_08060 [Burkholderia cepacia]AOK22697.1 hypothetical protein WK67_08025 [Burkholderia ubonensis]